MTSVFQGYEPKLTGKGVYRAVMLLIAHFTFFVVLVQAGFLTYETARLATVPVPVVAALLILAYSFGQKRGLVEELPSESKRTYDVALVLVVVASAMILLTAYVLG